MSDEMYFDKGSKLPAGIAVATLVTSDHQCCRDDCDSWRTIYVDVIQASDVDPEDAELARFAICLNHLGEFVDDMILRSGVTLLDTSDDENCGDPDCPVHGWMNQDEEDEDE